MRDGTLADVLGEQEPVRIPHGLQRVLAAAARKEEVHA